MWYCVHANYACYWPYCLKVDSLCAYQLCLLLAILPQGGQSVVVLSHGTIVG